MVRLLRCLVLAQSTPKLHHKETKRRFIVSIAVNVNFVHLDSQVFVIDDFESRKKT